MKARFEAGWWVLAMMVFGIVGCATADRDVGVSRLETPMRIEFAQAGSIEVASGQMIQPPRCCPPLELRSAGGEVVQEFDVTGGPQRLVARRGAYSLVGHDPGGEECVVQIKVADKPSWKE